MTAKIDAGGEGACPPEYVVCLSEDAAKQLLRTVRALEQYVEKAWLLCGVPNAEQ